MALIEATFFSPAIQKQVQLKAIVPDTGTGPFPVFYLLHGYSDDHSIWLRRTRIEMYVHELPLIVVMPDGLNGFYTDHEEGPAYGRYMIEDVIGFVERVLPVKKDRSARCVGGLSMGGYGALRLALAHPDVFVSATSHSGAAGLNADQVGEERRAAFKRIFGSEYRGTKHDVVALAEKVKKSARHKPKLRIDCGRDDTLFKNNQALHAALEKMGYKHEYAEFPGDHNWDYWDEHIREALEFHCKALGVEKQG